MKEGQNKVTWNITKILFVLIIILVVGYFASQIYIGLQYKSYKVRVTNVTDSAFTISWITDKPMEGIVYYSDKDNFLPGLLSWIGKQKAFDDRDVSNAQTECVDQFTKTISKTKDKDFTVDTSGFNCEDVQVKKLGKYYTHHVTVDNLEPNKKYYFRVGTRIVSNSKNMGVYADNELPGIEQFSTKTRDVFTELKAPQPAFGITYNLYYDQENNLVKNVSFDSLMFLLAKKNGEVLGYFSGVANSDGGWSIDMGNIRDVDGKIVEDTENIELEFIPQTENFLPANRKIVSFSDAEFPLLMVGNNHDTWENPEDEKQGKLSSKLRQSSSFIHLANASSKTWLYRSNTNSCEYVESDNGYDTEAVCLAKGKDNDKDEMIVGKESRECFDEDGCVCLFDKQGNNYMIRIDISIGEKCTPKTVCSARDRYSGKLDIQMGDMCIDPSGCECFRGSTYAGVNAECGCECGGECVKDDGEDTQCCYKTCDHYVTESGRDMYLLKNQDVNGKFCYNMSCSEMDANPNTHGNEYRGINKPSGDDCTKKEGPPPSLPSDSPQPPVFDNKIYTSLVELCGEFHAPAVVRYKDYKEGKENVLVCLANDDYATLKRKCKTGTTISASPSWQLIRIIENEDGTYSKGEVVRASRNNPYIDCPKVPMSLAIDIDKDKKIGEQVDAYSKYKCCVTEDSSLGVFAYKYSFQKDCSLIVDAEKCNIPLKKTYCIDSQEPNLLFAVLYAQSRENQFDNDKKICQEENGEGLRGVVGYSNKLPHYGKNCCKSSSGYKISVCAGSSQFQWRDCINNGKIGDVFHEDAIRYDEFKYGGKSYNTSLFRDLLNPIFANEEISNVEDTEVETVFFFPESGMYEINTYGGGTTYVMGDKDTSYFYFKNRDGIEGYQAPVDPANPQENEDIIVPREIAEVSISKSTTGKEIELKKGVNIISFNFLPTKGGEEMKLTSEDFLKLVNIGGRNVSSITYFSGGQWQGGISYDFEKQKTVGASFDLIFGKGYVVIAEEDVTITVPGHDLKSSVPIAFSSGWNLVGIHGYKKQYTAKSLINSVNTVEGLTANNVSWWPTSRGMYQGFQLLSGQEYGQDFPISSDLGYFVRISDFHPQEGSCRSILWNPGGQSNGKCGTVNN